MPMNARYAKLKNPQIAGIMDFYDHCPYPMALGNTLLWIMWRDYQNKERHRGHDCFVDRFTKMAHFVAIPANCDAGMTARIFMERVFVNHGMPRVLITDRDPRFTNRFWKHLMASLDCNHLMSTAYHPQTDGQTERTIRILKDMIRSFCNKKGNDWDTLLVPLEFAYNNSYQSSTQQTPFYLNNGRLPIIPETLALGFQNASNMDSGRRLQKLAKSHALAKSVFH